jgi:hypothetical protein
MTKDLSQKIIELMDLFDGEVTTADQIDRPQQALDREAIDDFNKRNPMAGGGMLVQPGFGGTRQGYKASKGKGIQLTAKEQKLLKDSLSTEDFNKLNFDRTGLQSGQKNYGVGRNDDKILLRKVRNILNPGQDSVGVKILNNKNYTDTVIKLTNQGKSPLEITNVLSKKDSKINRNVVSSAINSLIARKKLNKKYYVMPSSGLIKGDFDKKLKIVEKLVNKGDLGRADIGRKAGVADSVVEKWIRANKGDNFYETNYTYEKGILKKGNLQNQKDLFNLLESKKDISAAEISKIFKINNTESKKLMADLVGTIYRMSGDSKSNSLVVPYDNENRMREVLRKIRNAPDFEDIYQRRIGTLVREAYPKGAKRNQAVKSLGEYYKFSRALKEVAPELALSLDHVVPFQFLKEVKQGKNPMNLIKVKPIPTAINIFKSNFDSARINLNRELEINPTNKNTLNKFKVLKELEKITPLEFGGVSTKGNVYDFKAKPIGQSNLIEDAIEGLRTYNRIGKFSKQVLTDETLQKKLIEAGVDTGKDFSAFKKITSLSKATEDKVINTIVSYSKLKKCQISLNADGGRIGFANSIECIQDGLNEAKKQASGGDKKAAKQLVKTAETASKGGRLLKNVLGPGAILGEALFEGALIGNRLLEGKPLKQAWAQSYLSYLDPRKYSGQLDPTLLQREQMLESTADKDILRSGFAAQDQLSAFNKALQDRELAKARGRTDQYNVAAADAREQGKFADQSADIISGEAFKDASNIAQEYIQGKEGQRRFDLGILGTPRGELSEDRRMFEANKAMKNLYEQYSDDEVRSFLKQSLGTDDDKLIDRYLELTGVTERITPAVVRSLSGLDVLRTGDQIQQAKQRIADAGGIANLARGGRAGFKLGKLAKLKKSKVREDVKSIIDDSIKKQEEREFSPNLDLDALIKKTLDEDFFDKKDRIIDQLDITAAKKRKKYSYNQQVQEEPDQLDFYDDIVQSNFKDKTGPFFDYRRKNKAGGGILKQAGDSSGPPPESGPNSQGLQGLMKRGIKI